MLNYEQARKKHNENLMQIFEILDKDFEETGFWNAAIRENITQYIMEE